MDRDTPLLRIGQAARAAGVSVRALRFYERRGLLRPASRTEAGYRLYSAGLARRVRLIKWAQGLGFRLIEISRMLDAGHSGRTGESLRVQAARKASELARQIEQLRLQRRALEELASCRCSGACPIVERAVGAREGSRRS
jgi:DNA-binding transcriptional MerR regulator